MTRFVRQILVIFTIARYLRAHTLVERMTIGEEGRLKKEEATRWRERLSPLLVHKWRRRMHFLPLLQQLRLGYFNRPFPLLRPLMHRHLITPIKPGGRGMNHSKKLESVFSRLLEVRLADWSRQSYLANLDGDDRKRYRLPRGIGLLRDWRKNFSQNLAIKFSIFKE